MTGDLLLEIGTEEIPSGYFKHVLDLLSDKEDGIVRQLFDAQKIKAASIFSYSTPRRIILYVKDIPVYQDVVVEGPPTRVAFDENKNPTKALEGFLKKNNASIEDIEMFKDKRGERIRITKKDTPNKKILEEVLPRLIQSLDFPKNMRWNSDELLFARPIRWILAVFGKEVLNFSVGDLASSNITQGHRFLGHRNIRVKDTESYFKVLKKNSVIWDNHERKEKIASFLKKKNWHENQELLEEVNNLIEYPFFIEGFFKKEYLKLPREVLLASMSKHQRIFCLREKTGSLTNRFVAVINGRYRGLRHIRKNFENVLDARLKDALFFYESDKRTPIYKWAEGLGEVVFHKQLGTIKDKLERVKGIALFLTKYIEASAEEKKDLRRAVSLCKADLLTQMVREFPSLQGVMGGYYALSSGEGEDVAQAIREHYLPRFADDMTPATKLGIICSLADRLDNIICYFKIGKFPKAGWDIYALRRQAIGIISILLSRKLSISLVDLFYYAYDAAPGEYDKEELKAMYADFFKERFIYYIRERFDYRHDLLDSVTAYGVDDAYNSFLKLESLNSIIEKVYFEKARCIVERTHNIIRSAKGVIGEVKVSLFEDELERRLYDKFKEIRPRFKDYCQNKEYKQATEVFGEGLSYVIHEFFDTVMVNVDKKETRNNRLSMLAEINSVYVDNIADLSRIVVERA